MGVTLPYSGDSFFPQLPQSVQKSDPALYEYLANQRRILQQLAQGAFSNDSTLTALVNSGVSGTFVIASGGHIVVSSGIVTAVSTT